MTGEHFLPDNRFKMSQLSTQPASFDLQALMMTVDQMIGIGIEHKKSQLLDSAGIAMKYSSQEHLVQKYILADWVKPTCKYKYKYKHKHKSKYKR